MTVMSCASMAAERLLSSPIIGAVGCCARDATGHAAAPPSGTINSRRRMWIAMRPSHGGHAMQRGTIPHFDRAVCELLLGTDAVDVVVISDRGPRGLDRRRTENSIAEPAPSTAETNAGSF